MSSSFQHHRHYDNSIIGSATVIAMFTTMAFGGQKLQPLAAVTSNHEQTFTKLTKHFESVIKAV